MKDDDEKGTYLRVLVDREMLRYLLRRSDRNGESMSKYVGRLIRLDMAQNFSEKKQKKGISDAES